MARVHDELRVGRYRRQLLHHLLEGMVVERGRNGDDAGHERLSSPRRWAASPVAPRCPTFRAAATTAAAPGAAPPAPALPLPPPHPPPPEPAGTPPAPPNPPPQPVGSPGPLTT